MEERAVAVGDGGRGAASGFVLVMGGGRYAIVAQDSETCLIRAPQGACLRGYADIYEGEAPRARCLIVLAAPEGEYIRLTFKRRTAIRDAPPSDYAG